MGDERAIARVKPVASQRRQILLKMGEFKALEFEDLFQQTKRCCMGGYNSCRRQQSQELCQIQASSDARAQSIVTAIVESWAHFTALTGFAKKRAEY